MKWIEVAPGVQQVAARSKSPARSHAYALGSGSGLLLVEPAHAGEEEESWWIAWARENRPRAILLTHHHIDHTFGVDAIQQATGVEVWSPPRGVPTEFTPHQQYRIDRELRGGESLGKWLVVDLPGHAHEQIGLWDGRSILVADALAIGGGHPHEFWSTIRWLITLDPEIVLPAHGLPFYDHSFAPCARWSISGIL